MPGTVRKAHPALAAYVDRYVGYHHVLDPAAVHHGVASPRATIIIAFDGGIDVGWRDDAGSRTTYRMLASGLHTRPALIRTHGVQHGIQLDLTPLGVRALLGVVPGELGGTLVELTDLPLGLDDATYAELEATPDWSLRFDLLEGHLLKAHTGWYDDPAHQVRPEVGEAWRLFVRSGGRLGVEDVARRVGWSRRHLAARFAHEYGVGPKQAARLIRFDRARSLALAGRPLADVAHATGYADQAHLSREWRELAGQPPREALREQFPILQDSEAGPVASSYS